MSFTYDKRIIIYPAYINKKRTLPEGRKIPLEKACDDPTPVEIYDACKYLELEAEVQDNKSYSREWWVKGRVQVKLLNEDGTLANPAFPSRKSILLRVAELVPKHPSRKEKPQQQVQGGKQSKQDSKKKKGKRNK